MGSFMIIYLGFSLFCGGVCLFLFRDKRGIPKSSVLGAAIASAILAPVFAAVLAVLFGWACFVYLLCYMSSPAMFNNLGIKDVRTN